jgi:hypothetical protein
MKQSLMLIQLRLATGLTLAAPFGRSMFVLLVCAQGLAAQDKIFPKKGGPVVSGQIADINRDEVTIEVRGAKQKPFPIAEVRKITFDDEPAGLDRARELILQDQFDQALVEVKKLDAKAAKNPLITQDIEFFTLLCEGRLGLSGRGGNKKLAFDGLLNFAKNNSKSHHIYTLSTLLGDLAAAGAKPEGAVGYYNLLLKAKDPHTQNIGKYRLAQHDLGQGRTKEARTRLKELVEMEATSEESAALKSLAEVGLAVCDIREGQAQTGLDQLKQMKSKYESTDQILFARICNAQGAGHAALNQFNLAVLAYLQTDLLFSSDPETHAEALYQLSQLWPKAGDAARATEVRSRLQSQYAGSSWANK